MSDFKETVDNSGSQNQEISPGNRLRIAREQSGLTRKEAASHLKLSVDKIDLLERGEVDHLAAPVFVAGYLRAYAKLVGLPEEEIIEEFKASSEMEAPSVDPSASPAANNFGQMGSVSGKKGIQFGGKDWGQTAIWGSVVIVFLVILFVLFTDNDSEIVKNDVKKSNATETEKASTIDTSNVNAEEDIKVKSVDDVIIENVPEKIEVQEPIANNEEPLVTDKQVINSEIQKPNEKNLNHSVIVFNFNEDSWIEVNDALGERLLYRTGKAGTSRTVWGVSPFNIRLGYVAGVEIIFNGAPYDLSRFSNRRSARFKIGKSGDHMNIN